jgi:indolepyruvate ferredoxin oxidoreductase
VDAREATLDLFGDDQYANIFLVGVAVQLGALPIPAAEIESAITLNGVAVERNVQAFRRGRQLVADPDAFHLALRNDGSAAAIDGDGMPAADVDVLVEARVAELTAFQNAHYAERYATRVAAVREAEERTLGAGSTVLTIAVAQNLFKLMAYKDEYEVARLSIRPDLDQELREQFGDGARFRYRLHPPVLRALGMKRKISLGPWFRVVFRMLYGMRRLRGTVLDPFGFARVRRTERALIGEYELIVERLVERLGRADVAQLAEVAALPDMIRGYEDIKLRNAERYRAEVERMMADVDLPATAATSRGA